MPDRITGAHVSKAAAGESVRVALPAGTSLEKVIADVRLIDIIRGIGRPGGCETCISGVDIWMHQFEEVVLVELEE